MARRATINKIMTAYEVEREEAEFIADTIIEQAMNELDKAIRANKDDTVHKMKHKMRGYLEYVCEPEIDELLMEMKRTDKISYVKAAMRRIKELLNDL